MNEHYDYRRIRVRPRTWPSAAPKLLGERAEAIAAAGGTFYGLFLGQIGLGANEAVVMTAWDDAAGLEASAGLATEGVAEIVSERSEHYVATVRPRTPEPPKEQGVYAHRTFEIQERDWPEFVALSEAAWPAFESANRSRIHGFFRSRDVEPPRARVLLLTCYPSLRAWEESRGERPDSRTDRETWERFRRRHELTDATVVVTTQLAAAARRSP